MATISIKDATKDSLDLLKITPRDTYENVIARLISEHNKNVKP